MKQIKNTTRLAILASATLVSLTSLDMAHATKVKASCYLLDKKGEVIQGVNTTKRYEIASVSKVMTTFWATSVLGLNYRFETKVHVLPVGKGIADLHLEGGNDPFYNREQLQFLVSELNKLGVFHIRKMTFDEDFKFLASTREQSTAAGHYNTSYPTPNLVQSQVRLVVDRINGLYSSTRVRAKKINEMELPIELKLKVDDISFMAKEDFKKDSGFSSSSARHFSSQSVNLESMLKEMNRSSNNYAANIIFEALGGATEFQKFIGKKLSLKEEQIRFLNGSGDRYDYADGSFAYNEASCQAIIAVVGGLNSEMINQKSKLEDVMAVAGRDNEGEPSTVSGIYSSESTSDALIAKTGTVNPSIALAGLASTEQGDVYFGYIYGTNGTKADQRDARGHIRQDVVKLFSKFDGKKEINYAPEKFITFDNASLLKEKQKTAPAVAASAPPKIEAKAP